MEVSSRVKWYLAAASATVSLCFPPDTSGGAKTEALTYRNSSSQQVRWAWTGKPSWRQDKGSLSYSGPY